MLRYIELSRSFRAPVLKAMHRTSIGLLCSLAIAACSSSRQPSDAAQSAKDKDPGLVRESQRQPSEQLLVTEALPDPPPGTIFQPGIAACSRDIGSLDVFAVSSLGAVWNLSFDGSWHSWQRVTADGSTDTGVSATTRGSGQKTIDVFYRDAATQRLGHAARESDDDAEWQTELVGQTTISASAPGAVGSASGRIDVFARGADSTLRRIWNDGEWQADWATVSDVNDVSSTPTVTSSGPGRLDVFWARSNPDGFRHWWFDGTEHAPTSTIGDSLASAPAAASRGPDLLDVTYLLASEPGKLVHKYFDQGWDSEDYELDDAVSLTISSWGYGRIDVFYLDVSGAIRHGIVPSTAVLTQRNDIARTGRNAHEIELNVDNVASDDFGQLFTIPVDGNVWAQPLYQPTLDLSEQGQGLRNALYVATGNDSVYLFDADTGEKLVQKSLGNPVPVPYGDFTTGSGSSAAGNLCNFNMLPQIGITSTPVLDPETSTLYVVALTADEALAPETIAECAPVQEPTHTYAVQLHALDSRTLEEREGSPVTVAPNYEYEGQKVPFLANRQLQRPSLLLSQGKVYLAFGSYTDRRPYYGWVIAYDASTLAETDVFVATPEGVGLSSGGMGGIWQSGQGLAASPDGDIYFFTGNGPTNQGFALSNAAVELSSDLSLISSFRPFNADELDAKDLDLSSSGALLVPDTDFVVGGGKEGRLYVLTKGKLGSASKTRNDVAFEELVAVPAPKCVAQTADAESNIHSAPVYHKSENGTVSLYLMGEGDTVQKLDLNPASGALSHSAQSNERAACGMPGGFLSVSSNGDKPRTGIVWANVPAADGLKAVVPATFYAFDAETLETLYRDDRTVPDEATQFAKYVPPTIANGRVYQAAFGPAENTYGSLNSTYSGSVVVYGLRPNTNEVDD